MTTRKQFSGVFNAKKPIILDHVSTKYESLDYDRHSHNVVVLEEEARGTLFMASTVLQRMVLYILVGIFCGVCGGLMEVFVHLGANMKYGLLKDYVDDNFEKSWTYLYGIWILSIFIPAILGSLLVLYGEPKATGGGVHWCLGYCNGVNLDSHMSLRILVVKFFSCVLCVISGLPGGKEAPLIHCGAILGSMAPLMKFGGFEPFEFFNQEPERRDLAAAGTGAGLTSAFFSPIAGVMLSFEESLSFWNPELTFLMFICTITCFFTGRFFITTILMKCPGCVASEATFYLGILNKTAKTFYLSEIIVFICLGILGGLLGSLWNWFQKALMIFRSRYVNTQFKRLCDITFVIVIVGVIEVTLLILLSDECIEKDPSIIFIDKKHDNHLQLNCPEGTVPVMSLFLMQDPDHVLRSVFKGDESGLGILPLVGYGVYHFFTSCMLTGCPIAHGIFMPSIITGAIWGRLLAEIIGLEFPNNGWSNPNKFAYLCGPAQLCGCIRLTYTISVMMLEACNSTIFSLPLFIVVCFAKFTGSILIESVYHSQLSAAGIPMLGKEAPPMTLDIQARTVMATSVETVLMKERCGSLVNLLRNSQHNGFPVVMPQSESTASGVETFGNLKGFIQRPQLIALINNRLTEEMLSDKKALKKIRKDLLVSKTLNKDVMDYEDEELDLVPFMNRCPYIVDMDASLPQTYRLFANLGLRHLVVVSKNLEVVGVITRKDLSVYRQHTQFLHSETRRLEVI